MRWIAEVLDAQLKKWFGKLGYFIGSNPSYFVLIPPLIFCIFATGLINITETTDIERLYSPRNGEAKGERQAVQERFLENPILFYDPSRRTYGTRLGTIIFTPKPDTPTLLSKTVWDELVFTDEYVRNVTITRKGKTYGYYQLCAKFFLNCIPNDILALGDYVESGNVTFPYFTPDGWTRPVSLVGAFGSADLDTSSIIKDVPAIKLAYFMAIVTWEDDQRAKAWEIAFMKAMKELQLETVDVSYFTYQTMEDEMIENTRTVIPFFAVATFIILTFCSGSSMMSDWVRAKPLVSLQGVLSAMMATGMAFGLCTYLDVPFAGINMAAPFLMLGENLTPAAFSKILFSVEKTKQIGILDPATHVRVIIALGVAWWQCSIGMDDTFVVISAWRRTSIKDPVPKRLSEAYSDAAVSITITSLTDMMSYWVGAISPFEAVQTFCIYSGTSVALTYLFHVTFFGGCMAYAGRLEASNRHAVTYRKVLPKSEAGSRSRFYRLFCAGGISKQYPDDPLDNQDHAVMTFFRNKFALAISNKFVKIAVLIGFASYLGVGIWGITRIEEGLQRKHMVQETSYAYEFYETDDKYFRDYPYPVMLAILEPLDYSDPEVQQHVFDFIENAEQTRFVKGDNMFTQSWLRDFLRYSEAKQLDISDRPKFAKELREFLHLPEIAASRYFLDVRFSSNESDVIVASRYLVQAADMVNWNDDAYLMQDLRKVCRNAPFKVVPFQEYFIFFDQFLQIRPVTIQNVGIAAAVMLFVSLMLIPSPACAFWVGFSIVSIEVGVVGYMALWGVNLDAISMITVIMCIGFSVDFSAHVSYAFVSSDQQNPTGKIQDALHHMGLPILQGCLSTVLGIVPIIFAPSYIFYTFFKVTTLVMLFGTAHGLVLLPVLLSLFTPNSKRNAASAQGTAPTNMDIISGKNGHVNHGLTMEAREP